jgi:hypothetical protein
MLMGGAFGMSGDVNLATATHAYPRMPRTEQEEMSRSRTDRMASAAMDGNLIVARRRSGDGDPCIPNAPISFGVGGPVMC